MKDREIKLIKNNDNRDWEDIEWVREFYWFLQGANPAGITVSPRINLSKKKAMSIIWYLQEHLPVFPDQIEQCSICGELYDSYSQGHHSELTNKFYCDHSCEPDNLYEKEQRAEKKQIKQRNSNHNAGI